MKKELLLTGMLLTCTLVKSQVGINTQNPQGIFNIDGSKNNPATGVPTAAQMADDLVLTSNGNLGLGTTTPDTKLTLVTPDLNYGFHHTNGTISLKSYIGAGYASFGTSTNNDLRFTANNLQMMSLTAAGNVGIGTMTPDTKLTLVTPDLNYGFHHTNGTISLKSYIGSGYASFGTSTNNDLRFTANNLQMMSLTAAGNVGIGTMTPDTKLTISTPDNSFGFNHTNGTINLKSFVGSGYASFGTSTNNDLKITTNNLHRLSITAAGNVGIATATPQKLLHVSGSLQLDNELSLGGTATTPGSAGTNGQFLLSKGPGVAPQWTSVTIPVLNPGTFMLRGVYNFNLNDVFTNTNDVNLTLGNFNNIKIETPNNLVVIEFQTSTSVLTLSSGESMSYRYTLSGNNGIATSSSPYFYLLPSGFTPMNNLTSYKFYLTNVTPNTYNFILQAFRANTLGGAGTDSKYIHFNRTYNDSSSFIVDGKAVIYIYEQ